MCCCRRRGSDNSSPADGWLRGGGGGVSAHRPPRWRRHPGAGGRHRADATHAGASARETAGQPLKGAYTYIVCLCVNMCMWRVQLIGRLVVFRLLFLVIWIKNRISSEMTCVLTRVCRHKISNYNLLCTHIWLYYCARIGSLYVGMACMFSYRTPATHINHCVPLQDF